MAIASFLSRVAAMHLHFKFFHYPTILPGGVALCITEGLQCTELTVGSGTAGSLWRITEEQTNDADVIVGGYYRPPSQDNDADKLFFEELRGNFQVNCPGPFGELQLARS